MRRAMTVAAVALTLVSACSGDDDATETLPTDPPTTTTTTSLPPTTEPATTATTTTTAASPTTPPTTAGQTDDELKAQIAADYVAASERLDELASAPTLEGLDERLATISAPGSSDYASVRQFIVGMVERGERVINGEPDYSTVEVEVVQLVGAPPYVEAEVTYCLVTNRIRVDSSNAPQPGTGELVASRQVQTVVKLADGWRPSSASVESWGEVGASACPAA